MLSALLVVGLGVAAFVGFNIGGSSTGVAFGPAVGSKTLSKLAAAGLMSVFAILGGATVGTQVIETMGGKIVDASYFTLVASVAVLFFVGMALLISNLFGVPASTSMTAVGAIAGLGVARNALHWDVMGRIVSWWLVAPIIAFWVCAVIGRYFYPYLDAWFKLEEAEGTKAFVSKALVVGIGCYMAFSAGASNVANAVAPLVGSGIIGLYQGVALAGIAISLGAFTIARRTLDTVGNDLTDLPLLAALVVEVVSASLITGLSAMGIPASLAVSATMCIVGLGWGRATRTTRLSDAASAAISGEEATPAGAGAGVSALATEEAEAPENVPKIGEEDPDDLLARDLFDPSATGRVVVMWIMTPTVSALASYLVFTTVL